MEVVHEAAARDCISYVFYQFMLISVFAGKAAFDNRIVIKVVCGENEAGNCKVFIITVT